MPDLNGVQVTIVCNDQPLEEYEVTYEGDTATCWIPSEAGKVRAQATQIPSTFRRSRGDRLSGGSSAMRGGQVLTIWPVADLRDSMESSAWITPA
jgi:hypothetical protein